MDVRRCEHLVSEVLRVQYSSSSVKCGSVRYKAVAGVNAESQRGQMSNSKSREHTALNP